MEYAHPLVSTHVVGSSYWSQESLDEFTELLELLLAHGADASHASPPAAAHTRVSAHTCTRMRARSLAIPFHPDAPLDLHYN